MYPLVLNKWILDLANTDTLDTKDFNSSCIRPSVKFRKLQVDVPVTKGVFDAYLLKKD